MLLKRRGSKVKRGWEDDVDKDRRTSRGEDTCVLATVYLFYTYEEAYRTSGKDMYATHTRA
jgi:hypothetical protein